MRSIRRSIRKSSSRHRARFRRAVRGTVGLGLIVTATSALAQAPGEGDIALPPVDVRGERRDYRILEPSLFKFPDPIKDTPQSITVIPQDLMREQSVFSMREALRNVTGLSLNAGEGGSQGDNITLRGYSARNDIYLDGVRDWGSYTRDVFNLEAVEVLKGPSSAVFGRGSTGGIINQVSKTPQATPFREIVGTVGSGPLGRVTLDLNQPLSDSVAARLNAMFQQGEVVGRDYVDLQRWGVAPSVTLGMTGPTRLYLSYYTQHESSLPDNGLPYLFGQPAAVSRDTFYGLPDHDFQDTTVHVGTVRLDHTVNENVKLRSTLRYARYLLDQDATAPRIAGTPTPDTPLDSITVNRGIVGRERDDSMLDHQTDAIVTFATLGLRHTLVAGIELARETTDVTSFTVTGVPTATLVDPDPFPNLGALQRTPNTRAKTTAYTASAYLVDTLALTPQWKLLGGVRFDHFEADFENRTFTTTGATLRLDRTDDVASPRAAIVFQPTALQTYYFAWGTSFNPSAEALTLAVNTVNTPPEKTQSFELGAKWQLLENRVSLNTALFRIDKTDARTSEPGSLVQTLDGRQRSQGFEVEVVGRPLPPWSLFAGYTYLDTRVLESDDVNAGVPVEGKRLIAAPEHSMSFWTTYDLTSQWQIGAGVIYASERAANTSNTNTLPAYVKADATVAFAPWRNLEFRLNALNISDARYFDQVYQGHAPPAPGRTILFTTTFRF